MPFCTSCGKEISGTGKYCEYCGTPAGFSTTPPSPPGRALDRELVPESRNGTEHTIAHGGAGAAPPNLPLPVPSPNPVAAHKVTSPKYTKIILAGAAVIIVLPITCFVVLPKVGNVLGSGATLPPTPTAIPGSSTIAPTPMSAEKTFVPTPPTDPFPAAYSLKEWFRYNEGKYASRATVYRYWMNGTYQWYNDMDNRYYTQRPAAGNKYLLVYVNILNVGTAAYPYPKSNMIFDHYDGRIYTVDTSHYIPDKAGNRKATPIEIGEIQQQSDLFNSEYVEDYGYSHGTTSDFIYPGQSNAIDGYLIYEVPVSLGPEKTYVEIVFDGEDRAVWKLA